MVRYDEPSSMGDGLDIQPVPDAGALEDAGGRMSAAAAGISDAMLRVKTTWAGLRSVFWVSGAEAADVAMDEPELAAELFAANVRRGARAIEQLASSYQTLATRRAGLVERVASARARLAQAEEYVDGSEAIVEFGEVDASELIEARAVIAELRGDIAVFHADLDAEEAAFASTVGGVADDVVPGLDGTAFTGRVADWAVAGEAGSATDSLERQLAATVANRLDWLLTVSAAEARRWLADHPEFTTTREYSDPVAVSEWWADLSARSAGVPGAWLSGPAAALTALAPAVVGSLNGAPALDRVTANRAAAATWLAEAKAELADPEIDSERAAFLKNEIAYLKSVEKGAVQVYMYDRDASRIVEMIGTPTSDTERVVTYSPGTFTNLGDFYTGGVQQVSKYLESNLSSTVAFVYKDGVFPGENTEIGGMNLLRITEANDPSRTLEAGARLTDFEAGMRTDPFFAHAEQDAIGHSWGLANIAASEVAGTRYDKVISLSGAGMPPGWTPDPDTAYTDLSYDDLLQRAQRAGAVWDGDNPRTDPAFDHAGYYRGPDDAVLDDNKFTTGDLGVLSANHNLIATDSDANDQALKDLLQVMTQ